MLALAPLALPLLVVGFPQGSKTIELSGRLVPARQIEVPGPAGTRLVECVPLGKRVAKGETLARFDEVLEEMKLETEQARYKALRAELALIELDLRYAREQLKLTEERHKALYETGRTTQAQLDKELVAARRAYERAQRRIESGEARAREQEIRIARAERRLRSMRVVAPFDGVVLRQVVQPGEMLPGERGESSSKAVCVLADLKELRLRCPMRPHLLARVKVGAGAQLRSLVDPSKIHAAKLLYISPAVDPKSGSLWVEFAVRAASTGLMAGMRAQVVLELD